jgi:invasion protein IalB
MSQWSVLASVRVAVCVLAVALIGTVAVIATAPNSFAEAKKDKQQKKEEKGKQPPAQPQPAMPQLIFSPWTKICPKEARQVCFTGKDGRVETGQPILAVVLIEPEGEPRKILRITLPLGMSLQPGTRAIVDQGQPMTAPYVICFNNGCMADYEASQALIDTMKKGQGLIIQAINGAGQPISLVMPLSDFAKAYDGPPTDPKEVDRRNEDLRKKFEQQQKNEQQQKK